MKPRVFLALVLASSAPLLAAVRPPPSPRPVTAAERAAVELALAYAERGPSAWRERLAPDSALAALDDAAIDAEIAVRCGPPEGAEWQLQTPGATGTRDVAIFTIEFPSGIDETLELRLTSGSGGWRIASLRSLSDPAPPPTFAASNAPAARAARGGRGGLALGLVLLLLWLASRRGAPARRSAGHGRRTAAATLVVAIVACSGPAGEMASEEANAPEARPWLRLAPLAPLRTALAAGDDRGAIERAVAQRPSDPELAHVADLWRAQLALVDGDLTTAEPLLAGAAADEALPLERLLAARMAIRRLDGQTAGWHYQRAIEVGPDHDGLRLEAVLADRLAGDDSRSTVEVQILVERGTRLADPWYEAAGEALIAEHPDEAEAFLRTAWQLSPLAREQLFDDPLTAALVARPAVFPLLELDSPDEPRIEPPGERVPVQLPATADARLCGSELSVELGSFELLVPGGAALSGPLTEIENSSSRRARREREAMDALPRLHADSLTGVRWAPRQLRLAETAARVLTRKNRWNDLLDLTEGVARRVDPAASRILRYRALAFSRLERDAEARQLLVALAKRELESRRPSPGTLYDLADVLASEGDYETAIRLVRKADSRLPYAVGEQRLRQYEMRRDLEAASRIYRSKHFEIRYPRATGERYASQVSTVLELERDRISRWIPKRGGDRIEVDLFPLQQFYAAYGGGVSVAGLFDGRVRVPFADLRSLHPSLVAILSHELAHAMLAETTDDLAPKWFHEGLAQHIEMGTGRVNPLPDLAIQQHAIAFPALEAILAGFAEPQLVDLAYTESAWAVFFLETRWGVGAIQRLQREFAAGADTEQAIRTVTGLSLAEFDAAFWRWGTREAPSARTLEVRRYDEELDSPLERAPELTRVDRSIGRAPGWRPSDPERNRFAEWHATYLALAAPVKAAYKPIVAAYRNGGEPPLAHDCERLLVESRKMFADGRAFRSSDNDVNRTLEEVYRLLGDLGESCRDGRKNEARVFYERVGKALAVAAEALEPWQLAP